jgi:ABC-type uncharacterized transport system permease subunit
MADSFLLPVTVIGYIVGIVLAILRTLYRSRTARRLASIVFAVTWLFHTVTVVREGIVEGRLPLTNMAEYLLVLGWIVLTLHLYLWYRLEVEISGVVLLPLAAVMTFVSMELMRSEPARSAATPDGWFLFHTTVSTLGMAFLSVAFAMSVIYLAQDRVLKSKKAFKLLDRLPSLQKADQIGVRSLTVGFILLTMGIGTGVVVNAEVHERLVVMGPKQIFPVLAWLVFAAILIFRPMLGFRGRKSAYLTIAGFALGLLTVIGMTL